MRKLLTFLSSILFVFAPLFAQVASAADQSKEDDRLRNCGTVLKEILDLPDDIPKDLLDKADCVVVFPSVLKTAFIVGGSYGRAFSIFCYRIVLGKSSKLGVAFRQPFDLLSDTTKPQSARSQIRVKLLLRFGSPG
jgi:hypothetical protein